MSAVPTEPGAGDERAVFPRIALLGTPVLQSPAGVAAIALPPRAHTVLALLALRHERPVPRSALAALLWPDVTDEEARTNLRRHLYLIVRTLPADAHALLLTKSSAQWNPDARISCDVVEFLVAARTLGRHTEAARLYAGELCAGIVDEPLEALRDELNALHDAVLRNLAEVALHSGDRPAELLALHRLVQIDPLDETSARRLVIARFEAGDRAGALREYYALVARLRTELDVDPQPETSALLERMLSTERQSSTPHNLVTPTSSLIGRGVELRSILEALEHERLVTLVGSPGIGKTRLAIEAASIALDRFAAGVYFVDLAREQNAAAAIERTAQIVGAPSSSYPLESLVGALEQKQILLVLDNLEQLGADAQIVTDALVARSAVHILATSRRRVGGPSEHIVAVGALALPPVAPTNPRALISYPSVRMFLERASKSAPNVRLTFGNARSFTTIARRLDGIPLAIELVASRANLLTIDGIAKRLDEHLIFTSSTRGDRHRTIDAAIAWSYELLSPVEKAVFRRVAVFADSCTVEALEDVCAPVDADCVGPISELVESSLLTAAAIGDTIRYHTFEVTRAFAAGRLRDLGEYDEAARRHADHYARCIEAMYGDFTSDAEQDAFAQCDLENRNFELALAWSFENDPVLAARLVAALWRFWIFRGRARFGEECIERLEREGVLERLTTPQRARVLQAAGMFARETNLGNANPYLERALALFRECADTGGEIEVLNAVAAVSFMSGAHARAEQQFTDLLALQESRSDRRGAAGSLANLAQMSWIRGDCREALKILERALAGFSETKNARGVAYVFRTRSAILGTLRNWDEAIAQAEQSVLLYEALGEPARVAEALSNLGSQSAEAGKMGPAFDAICRSLEILAEVGHDAWLCNALRSLHFAASRAREHQEVLRIDGVLRRLAQQFSQDPDTFDGSTQHSLALARTAVARPVADAILQSTASMDQSDMLAIARQLRDRHAQLVVEPFDASCIGRSSDA
ncbi:MAG: BTAD domain-containing putative transcriptional regulator [Candidatus Velthaea sp.]